jgi:ABC-type multidrug transport system fused ATPase/permease subunit
MDDRMNEKVKAESARSHPEREELRKEYLFLAEKYRGVAAREKRMLTRYSMARLILFLAVITGTALLWTTNLPAALVVAVAGTGLFVRIVILFGRSEWNVGYYSMLEKINRDEAASMEGDWSAFSEGNDYSDPGHDFSNDIDLFGKSSLFNYLDRTVTEQGNRVLAQWLSNPMQLVSQLTDRQKAVKALAPEMGWRQEFMTLGRADTITIGNQKNLMEWIEQPPFFRNRLVASGVLMLFPLITIAALILVAFSVTGISFFIFMYIVNLFVLSLFIKRTNRLHGLLSGHHRQLSSLGMLVEQIGKLKAESVFITDIKERLAGNNMGASESVTSLSRVIKAFDVRLNMVAGVLLNGLLLWDYIQIMRLERWRDEVRTNMADWFRAVSETDAIISLANYAHNNPEYAYPQFSEGEAVINAAKLGHPLIDHRKRVVNDFIISEEGEIFIVTGANMSGKSTFLRTVAVNMVLAMTGAPVCATRFTFTPLNIFSSMRTSDSLAENESYFYAELKRLRYLKERIESGERVIFLLDEILKGTNSKDKSEGSWSFIEKIISLGGTGVIATHDTSLGNLSSAYPEKIRNRCFEIEIQGDDILFDYLLRDGVTTRMNAGILMRQQGIID